MFICFPYSLAKETAIAGVSEQGVFSLDGCRSCWCQFPVDCRTARLAVVC